MSKMFSKEYFAELVPSVTEFLNRVWNTDKKMVEFCLKDNTYYKLPSGFILPMKKPSIETKFCFGYHTDYSGHECSDAEATRKACANSTQYFLNENLRRFNSDLEALTDNDNKYVLYYHYVRFNELMVNIATDNESRFITDGLIGKMSDEDRKYIIEIYKFEKEKFEKRLQSYLKRYGLSKIKSWTYWLDE